MEIVLYDCRQVKISASNEAVSVVVRRPKLKKLSLHFGYNLIILAVLGIVFAVSPALFKEVQFRFGAKIEESPARATFGQIIKNEEISKRTLATAEAKQYGVQTDFSLVIPKINAVSKVIPNVHPGDKEEYETALKQGVAHASGSAFPGQQGTIFLFSHSTNADYNIERFNAVFYLLKELTPGDKIIVFYAGQKFTYLTVEKKVIEAEDTSLLTEETEEERLILQTCWPPGTSIKRLVVIAKPI